MSNEALSWAWTVPCPPTAKLVLVALADRANEAGECFPSVRDLEQRTGLTDRAIQKNMAALMAGGWLERTFRAGRATIYRVRMDTQTPEHGSPPNHVHPRTTFTPPPNVVHPTPEPRSPHPRTTFTHNPHVTHTEPTPNPQRDAPPVDEPLTLTPKPKREPGGTRLPMDWHPSVAMESFALGLGLNAQTVAAQFRDYWHAAPGAKGRKADWDATWRNWCRRDAERPKPKLHTLPAAEQDRRILAAVGLGFSDPPPIVQPMRRIAQ